MLIAVGLLLIVTVTVATGYFVLQEFAYVAVDRRRLGQLADNGDAAAKRALRVTGRLSFMLSGAQLGITLTALLAGYVAEPYLGEGLAELLGRAGLPRPVALSISVGAALAVATVVQMVLGELAPKNLAIARPERLARALSRSTLLYLAMAGPVIRVFDAASNRLLRRVGVEPVEELPTGVSSEDLVRIVAESRANGHLDADMSRLLEQGLKFRSRTADEVMVPRVDVVTVRADEPAARVVELLDTGHSRFPVIGTEVDDLVGVASLTDVRDVPAQQRSTTPVSAIAVPCVVVPESVPLPVVLERLRTEHRQMACVLDEYGGFAGVITLEDIAEELVGAIQDEDDLPEHSAEIQPDLTWLVPGRWRLDEIAEATGIALPGGKAYDTVSGLVLQRLGRVPAAGDVLDVEVKPDPKTTTPQLVRLVVVSVRRHVPHIVRIIPAGHRETGLR